MMENPTKLLTTALCCISVFTVSARQPDLPKQKHANPVTVKSQTGCAPAKSWADLDIANVRARIQSGGDMWWDLIGNPKYEVPKGSSKHAIFAGALWIGGIDANKNLRVAAQSYRQGKQIDFWTGPLSTLDNTIPADECLKYDKLWKITRQEVEDFKSNGTMTTAIYNWPGNGDPSYNEAPTLAPFFDKNADGIYNPADGDYPLFEPKTGPKSDCYNSLHGDEAIWWVFNDAGNNHTASNSTPIGLEIQAQAFAYDTQDAISYCTFYQYKIINRSSTRLDSCYIGQFVDADLGNYDDDLVGCDVKRGLGYCYNGDDNDEGPKGYGLNPPAIGVDFIHGPYADANDKIDNNHNGIIDEVDEDITMSSFMYFNNDQTSLGPPQTGVDYYTYLKSLWKDKRHLTFGGDGRGGGSGGTSNSANYMFPGDTDPAFPAQNWTEKTAQRTPADRRFIMSAGQFTMAPGEVSYLITGVIYGKNPGTGGATAAITALQQVDDQAQALFSNGCFTLSVPKATANVAPVNVYPNPFSDYTSIHFSNKQDLKHAVTLYDINGRVVRLYENIQGESLQVSKENLSPGIYFIKLSNANGMCYTGKMIVQ